MVRRRLPADHLFLEIDIILEVFQKIHAQQSSMAYRRSLIIDDQNTGIFHGIAVYPQGEEILCRMDASIDNNRPVSFCWAYSVMPAFIFPMIGTLHQFGSTSDSRAS
mgnify:CR=1 FL=1